MLREDYQAELRSARRTKVGVMLVHAAVVVAVGLASAVSGATVALHLAEGPAAGQHLARPGAATRAVVADRPMEQPMRAAAVVPADARATAVEPSRTGSDASADITAGSAPPAASPPLAERQLTFAWGYAQRHPGASARQPETRGIAAPAGARGQGAAMAAHSQVRRPAERHASAAQGRAVAPDPSGFFSGFAGDPHQAFAYAAERRGNGAREFDRAQPPPSPRHHSSS